MLRLERAGLGSRQEVSIQRDKFMLDPNHGTATLLSRRLEANGFIRADENTLLFRDASEALYGRLAGVRPEIAVRSDKGFEVRWSSVDVADVERMFDTLWLTVRGHVAP
jgi:hypothetical protein